jgi:hypothetical protein
MLKQFGVRFSKHAANRRGTFGHWYKGVHVGDTCRVLASLGEGLKERQDTNVADWGLRGSRKDWQNTNRAGWGVGSISSAVFLAMAFPHAKATSKRSHADLGANAQVVEEFYEDIGDYDINFEAGACDFHHPRIRTTIGTCSYYDTL